MLTRVRAVIRRTLLASALLGSACGGQAPRFYTSPEPLEFAEPFPVVWRAVIDVATAMHVPLATIEMSSGYLRSERVGIPEPAPGAWWDCGGGGYESGGQKPTANAPVGYLSVAVIDRGTVVHVRVTASSLVLTLREPCTSTGGFEITFMDAVRTRVREWQRGGEP